MSRCPAASSVGCLAGQAGGFCWPLIYSRGRLLSDQGGGGGGDGEGRGGGGGLHPQSVLEASSPYCVVPAPSSRRRLMPGALVHNFLKIDYRVYTGSRKTYVGQGISEFASTKVFWAEGLSTYPGSRAAFPCIKSWCVHLRLTRQLCFKNKS